MTTSNAPKLREHPTNPAGHPDHHPLVARGTVVALHGPSGVGKDWVAQEILAKQGYQPWAIAYPMKAMLVADLVRDGMDTQEALRTVFVDRSPSTRDRLLGGRTGVLRSEFGEDVFARIALAYLGHRQRTVAPLRGVALTDARSHRETSLLIEAGAIVIHLQSKGLAQRHNIGAAAQHTIEVQGAKPPAGAHLIWNNHDDPQATRDAVRAALPERSAWPHVPGDELPLPPLNLHAWMLATGCQATTPAMIAKAVDRLCANDPQEQARVAQLAAEQVAREGEVWAAALADSWGWIRRNLWRTRTPTRGGR